MKQQSIICSVCCLKTFSFYSKKAFIFCWIEFFPLPYLFVNALDNQSYSLWFPLITLPTILLYGSHSAYVSTFAKPSLTALILALYNSHYDEYIVIALHLICKLLFTLLQKCIVVFIQECIVRIHTLHILDIWEAYCKGIPTIHF